MALVRFLVEVLVPCRGTTFGRGLTPPGITFTRNFALSLGGCGAVPRDDFDEPCSTFLLDGQKKYKYDLQNFTQLPKINPRKKSPAILFTEEPYKTVDQKATVADRNIDHCVLTVYTRLLVVSLMKSNGSTKRTSLGLVDD